MGKLSLEDKNVLLITDGLDDYLNQVILEDSEIKFYQTNLKNLSKELEKIEAKVERDNIIIIIKKENYNIDTQKEIESKVLSKLNLSTPFFLLVTEDDCSIKEQERLLEKQIFYYKLLDKNTKEFKSFYFFIILVFQRLKDIDRLDNYIVNAFQTIIDSEIINKQKQKIEKLYKELDALSRTDYLTKVYNRKAFFEAMESERNRALRKEWRKERLSKKDKSLTVKDTNKNSESFGAYGKFTCIMIDIDHFKKVNDTHGHIVGDNVLKELGRLLRSKLIFRDNDLIGRYGGEEFVVVLPETGFKEARIPAERLREKIKEIDFKGKDGEIFHVYISVGISEFKLTDKSNNELINRADKALYYAKRHGRDQVAVYEEVIDKKRKKK